MVGRANRNTVRSGRSGPLLLNKKPGTSTKISTIERVMVGRQDKVPSVLPDKKTYEVGNNLRDDVP